MGRDRRGARPARSRRLIARWGEGTNLAVLAPTAADDPQMHAWLARLERLAASPGQARRLVTAARQTDVRPELGSIRAPTLVLHRTDEVFVDVRHGREYARRIAGAQLVELPGVDSLPSAGDSDAVLGEIEEFLTGGRRGGEQERALLTVLFTDIVGSTARAATLGDKRWRDLLAVHDTEVRRTLGAFDGDVIQRIGDGFLAVFDGAPSRAVRCARALREVVAAHGVDLRIGLHTGECEIIGDDVGGMAVHIASRVGSLAEPGEILVSGHDVRHGLRRRPGLRLPGREDPQGRPRPLADLRAERLKQGRRTRSCRQYTASVDYSTRPLGATR